MEKVNECCDVRRFFELDIDKRHRTIVKLSSYGWLLNLARFPLLVNFPLRIPQFIMILAINFESINRDEITAIDNQISFTAKRKLGTAETTVNLPIKMLLNLINWWDDRNIGTQKELNQQWVKLYWNWIEIDIWKNWWVQLVVKRHDDVLFQFESRMSCCVSLMPVSFSLTFEVSSILFGWISDDAVGEYQVIQHWPVVFSGFN